MGLHELLPPDSLPAELESVWRRAAAKILQLARGGHLRNAQLYATHNESVWLLEVEVTDEPNVEQSSSRRETTETKATLILTLLLKSPCPWESVLDIVDAWSDARVDLDQLTIEGSTCRASHPALPITIDIIYGAGLNSSETT